MKVEKFYVEHSTLAPNWVENQLSTSYRSNTHRVHYEGIYGKCFVNSYVGRFLTSNSSGDVSCHVESSRGKVETHGTHGSDGVNHWVI